MNASDIIKAKQNRVLFQSLYRPNVLTSTTYTTYCPVSSFSTGTTTYTSCINTIYPYTCNSPSISYELLNDINQGKYLCGYPYCSSISEWNTGRTFPTGVCNSKISEMTWKNTNSTIIYNYSTASYSSIITVSTSIMTGPGPLICPLVDFYQGTNFDSRCETCNNSCCSGCVSGQ
jgi:hypothetical protein